VLELGTLDLDSRLIKELNLIIPQHCRPGIVVDDFDGAEWELWIVWGL
jgi:hypothetical protein